VEYKSTLVVRALNRQAYAKRLPQAVMLVHLYGQIANLDPILETCDRDEVSLIEDAAETLGATYSGLSTSTPFILNRQACDRTSMCVTLNQARIEARPVWKPLHLQPSFAGCEYIGGEVAQMLFERGLCLPSGSSLTPNELNYVIDCFTRQCAT
jgi:dTDP-4-amino-4,6-dideoxygalactose transaminase